jgi:DnaJ family protein C protein 9
MLNFPNRKIKKKKSYRKMALKYHPDKLEKSDQKSKDMFQKILTAYNILKDTKKREIYDRTGEVSENDPGSIEQFVEAYQYYRNQFPELKTHDIESFGLKYRFSKSEEEDLLKFYIDNEGDMTYILQNVILSRNEDVSRFMAFFEEKLNSGESRQDLMPFKRKFMSSRKKIKKLNLKEAKEASKIKNDRLASLKQAIILKRQNQNKSFLDNLEKAFLEETGPNNDHVLKDNKKVTNQGKRSSPNLLKPSKKIKKMRKKVQVSN